MKKNKITRINEIGKFGHSSHTVLIATSNQHVERFDGASEQQRAGVSFIFSTLEKENQEIKRMLQSNVVRVDSRDGQFG